MKKVILSILPAFLIFSGNLIAGEIIKVSPVKKIIKVSQFYHSNYLDLKKAIETKTRNLGEEPFSLFKELKEIFVA